MKGKIKEDLANSGLWHWKEHSPWPSADESESILAELGLQVVWVKYELVLNGNEDVEAWSLTIDGRVDNYMHIIGAKKGQRTIANNAAIAWLSMQPKWFAKLKTVIELKKMTKQTCPECKRQLRVSEAIQGYFLNCEYCLICGPIGKTKEEAESNWVKELNEINQEARA